MPSLPWLQRVLEKRAQSVVTHVVRHSAWQAVRHTAAAHQILTPEQQRVSEWLQSEAVTRHLREQVETMPSPGRTMTVPPSDVAPVSEAPVVSETEPVAPSHRDAMENSSTANTLNVAPSTIPDRAAVPMNDPLGLAKVREEVVAPALQLPVKTAVAGQGAAPPVKIAAVGSVETPSANAMAAAALPTRSSAAVSNASSRSAIAAEPARLPERVVVERTMDEALEAVRTTTSSADGAERSTADVLMARVSSPIVVERSGLRQVATEPITRPVTTTPTRLPERTRTVDGEVLVPIVGNARELAPRLEPAPVAQDERRREPEPLTPTSIPTVREASREATRIEQPVVATREVEPTRPVTTDVRDETAPPLATRDGATDATPTPASVPSDDPRDPVLDENSGCRSELFACDQLNTWTLGVPLAQVRQLPRSTYAVAVMAIRGEPPRAMVLDPYRQQVALCALGAESSAETTMDQLMQRASPLQSDLMRLEIAGECPAEVSQSLAAVAPTTTTTRTVTSDEEAYVFRTRLSDGEEIGLDASGNILRLGEQLSRLGRLAFSPRRGLLAADRALLFAASDTTVAFVETAPVTILATEHLQLPYARARLSALLELPSSLGNGLLLIHQLDGQSIITWLPHRANAAPADTSSDTTTTDVRR